MTTIDLTTSLSLLIQGRCQLSFARDPSCTMKAEGGGGGGGGGANDFKGGQFASK